MHLLCGDRELVRAGLDDETLALAPEARTEGVDHQLHVWLASSSRRPVGCRAAIWGAPHVLPADPNESEANGGHARGSPRRSEPLSSSQIYRAHARQSTTMR